MPGDGGAAGRTGWAMGIAGLGATGAGAAGLGATAAIGFAATAGLRAGALRAAGFRTAFLVVLRAEVFFAVVLRAVARFAVVLRAPVLRAVLRAARAVLRTVRAAFLAVLRGFAFLLVVRFFPLVLVAMALCSASALVAALDRSNGRMLARITLHWSRLAVPQGESIVFFHYTMIASESGNLGCSLRGTSIADLPGRLAALHQAPIEPRMGMFQALTGFVSASVERAQNILDPHAMAEVGIDKTGFDAAILADHEGCGYRQEPSTLALKPLEIDTKPPVGLLDLVADPEDEAKRERIG